ncbi:hypothetical protein BJ912DRAFT_1043084 [Pholiota molesta]|nr:hypothetical protein BJ912DRAFT_1043084 [Pholiota molesta]
MTLTILSGLSPYSSELGLLRPEFVDIRQPKSRLGNRKLLHPTSHRKQLTTPLIVRSEVQGGVPNTLPKSPAARGCRRMWAYDVASALDFAQDGGEAEATFNLHIFRLPLYGQRRRVEYILLQPTTPYPPAAPQYASPNYDGVNEPTIYEDPYALTGSDAHQHIMSTGQSGSGASLHLAYNITPSINPHYTYPNYDGANEPTVYEDPYALHMR